MENQNNMIIKIFEIIKKNLLLSLFVLTAIILTVFLAAEKLKKEIFLIKTSPLSGEIRSFNPYGSLYFYFSDKLDKKTVQASVSPAIKIEIKVEEWEKGSVLRIYPKKSWEFDQNYILTINNNLSSIDGGRLKTDVVFSFKYVMPRPEEIEGPKTEDAVDFRNFNR